MNSFFRMMIVFSAFAFAPNFAMVAHAQDAAWREKTVWTVTYVKTKAGTFNEYMTDLSGLWKSLIEQQIKDGKAISYKILNVAYPRDNEPDILLLVEYKNMAAMDNDLEYTEKLLANAKRSRGQADQAAIEREKLRDFRGIVLTRELNFSK